MSVLRPALAALTALALVATRTAAAQRGSVLTGTVRDDAGRPVAAAEVSLQPGNAQTRSDSAGRFRLANIEPASYHMTVRRIGFEPAERDVRIVADSAVDVAVTLVTHVQLDTVKVSAGTCSPFQFSGFLCRKQLGRGDFLSIATIDSADFGNLGVGDLFLHRKGYSIGVTPGGRRYPITTNGECLTQLVDGHPPGVTNQVPRSMKELIGVEIYDRPDDVPKQYEMYTWTGPRRCALAIYWTGKRK